MNRFVPVLLLIMMLWGRALSQGRQLPITLHDPAQLHLLAGKVEVLEDPNGEWEIGDVLEEGVGGASFGPDERQLSYGFTDAAYWFKFRLRNESADLNAWALEIPYPIIDDIQVYQLNEDGVWDKTQTGDSFPFYQRPIIYRNFVIPLKFIDHSVHTVYVRVSTSSSMRVPMRIRSFAEFRESSLETEIMYGVYFGIMLVMLVYNLMVFFTLNDTSYLYYVLSIFCTASLFSALSGHAFQYLWYDSIWWANNIVSLSMGGLAVGSALFAQSFLEVKKYSMFWHRVLAGIIGGGAMIIVATFAFGYGIAVLMGVLVLAIDSIALLATGITCWYKGNKAARYYVFAWVCYLIGAFLIILVSYGLLPSHPILLHAVEVGSAIEVMLLAIALSDKYSIIRQEKEKLQAETLEGQRKMTSMLEEQVEARTVEINRKKEEIERKNKRLESQNKEIAHQKDNIEGSIRYAQRIQAAMLPSDQEIQRLLPDSFIFFKPRDIVSGDFYWVSQKEDLLVIAVSDCTGHGVPGAFMSMLGTSLLGEIVNQRNITTPDRILFELNEGVRKSLSQDFTQNHDGMEISICVIDKARREVHFAGANSSIITIHDYQLELIKGERLPIGGHRSRYTGKAFRTHQIAVEPGTALYLFTDGFRDQFGGANGEKFMMRRFQAMLKDIHQEPMEAQEIIITRTFKDWVGQRRQIDDVLIMGLRLDF